MSDDLNEYLISVLNVYSSGSTPEEACKTFLSSLLEIAADGCLDVIVVDEKTNKAIEVIVALNPDLDPHYSMSRRIMENVSARREPEEDI